MDIHTLALFGLLGLIIFVIGMCAGYGLAQHDDMDGTNGGDMPIDPYDFS